MTSEISKPVTEQELQAHAVARRITPQDIQDQIALVSYSDAYDLVHLATAKITNVDGEAIAYPDDANISDSLTAFTICTIVLKNGFIVLGQSAPVVPANFSSEIGQRLAYQDAFNKLWPLFGFELKQRILGEKNA